MTEVRHVDAQLVRDAGSHPEMHEREVTRGRERSILGCRVPPSSIVGDDHPLAAVRPTGEWRRHCSLADETAVYDREVLLHDRLRAERVAEAAIRERRPRSEEETGGAGVEAMDEAGGARRIDRRHLRKPMEKTGGDGRGATAPGRRRQAGRLVDRDELLVAVDDRERERQRLERRGRLGARVDGDLVPCGDEGALRRDATVHAHRTCGDQRRDGTPPEAGAELVTEEAVDAS